jgi:general secretion pathway protein C
MGDRVGTWRTAAIDWDRVWVQAGGPRCALPLHGMMARDAGSDRPAPWLVPEAIAQAIEKRSETEYRIDRSAVSEIFEQGGNLLIGVRLQPLSKSEREFAIELEHVPMDSLLERLGVQSGDVLESLNGVRCATPAATVEALVRARVRSARRAAPARRCELRNRSPRRNTAWIELRPVAFETA